eukprot:CAMPEP_0194138022 /NCGR_PEP_ID=MMETSP0152-20130528/7867_1 /TAXON_ID=1049557 /ORGANISM="Thalassiothrix antarctica, Strain L6-D1" /LENGTH=244 /DNA_ID=CAMNT_0038835293 /DNA_START=68 /DNA_END=802 /DNA_ORIENTATION=-
MAMTKPEHKLRLHLYDHCPYCIRVELTLGLKNKSYDRVVYGYGDKLGDESKRGCYDGGVVLTGKKELPVLEKIGTDGKREWIKAESLDIIEWVQEQTDCFQAKSGREDLRTFFDTDGRFKVVQRLLTHPRKLKMTNLKDWSREEDRVYAKTKYEKGGFDYAAAEACDAESITEMKTLLEEASNLLKSDDSLYEDGVLGFDDLLYLPEFRTVSMVKGVEWPERLRKYVVSAHSNANVGTYFQDQV